MSTFTLAADAVGHDPRSTSSTAASIPTYPSRSPSLPQPQSSHMVQRTSDRLSLPFALRSTLAITAATISGLALGTTHGGQQAGLVFRAENAHRLPTSQLGWYFYHKSKNYHVMLGGLREGLRMGVRLGVGVAGFVYVEEAVDRVRGAMVRRMIATSRGTEHGPGHEDVLDSSSYSNTNTRIINNSGQTEVFIVQRDFLSTTVAAMGVVGAFGAWNRLPMPAFARTARMGLRVGLLYGLAQDGLSLLRGNRLGYVETIRGLMKR